MKISGLVCHLIYAIAAHRRRKTCLMKPRTRRKKSRVKPAQRYWLVTDHQVGGCERFKVLFHVFTVLVMQSIKIAFQHILKFNLSMPGNGSQWAQAPFKQYLSKGRSIFVCVFLNSKHCSDLIYIHKNGPSVTLSANHIWKKNMYVLRCPLTFLLLSGVFWDPRKM